MNYVIAVRIPIETTINKMLYFGAGVVGLVADGNYNGLINNVFNPSYINNPSLDNVITLTIDGVPYVPVENENQLFNNPRTFLWNDGRELLLIKLPNSQNLWSLNEIVIGVSFSAYKTNMDIDQFDGRFGGVQYKNILLKVPPLEERVDDAYTGQMSYLSGSISMQNNDGLISRWNEDDNFENRPFFIETWFGEDPALIDLQQSFAGIVTKLKAAPEYIIEFRDAREKFKELVPNRVLDLEVWPDADASFVIPEVWGTCKKIQLECLNENAEDTNWKLMLADVTKRNIQGIDKLYYDGVAIVAPAIQIADDIAFIEMSYVTYPSASDFVADVSGYIDDDDNLIENALDIIAEKINQIYGQGYNDVYFDTAAWELARPFVYDINYYMQESMKFKEMLEKISSSSGGTFEIDRRSNKYTFIVRLFDLGIDITVPEIRFMPVSDRNAIEYETEKTIQTCRVGYAKRWSDKTHSYHTDSSRREDIKKITNSENIIKAFDTLLTKQAHARDMCEKHLYLYGRKLKKVTKLIPLNAETIQIAPGRFVSLEFVKDGFMMGYQRAYVLSTKKDFDNSQIGITAYLFQPDNSGYLTFTVDGVTYDATLTVGGTEYDWYVI